MKLPKEFFEDKEEQRKVRAEINKALARFEKASYANILIALSEVTLAITQEMWQEGGKLTSFCKEVASPPYPDSDPASLLETLQKRARALLEGTEDD